MRGFPPVEFFGYRTAKAHVKEGVKKVLARAASMSRRSQTAARPLKKFGDAARKIKKLIK